MNIVLSKEEKQNKNISSLNPTLDLDSVTNTSR